MAAIGEMTLEDAAQRRGWQLEVVDVLSHGIGSGRSMTRSNWSIVYTHNRDSGLLDQCNAEVIAESLKPFSEAEDPDVVFESHSHWAVGHVDGFSIRVYP